MNRTQRIIRQMQADLAIHANGHLSAEDRASVRGIVDVMVSRDFAESVMCHVENDEDENVARVMKEILQ